MNPRENYMAVMDHKTPEWVPVYSKPVRWNIGFLDAIEKGPAGGGLDGFGVLWNWDDTGPCPSTAEFLVTDITKWKETVRFPDLDTIDWAAKAEKELAGVDRTVQCVEYCMGNGPFERLLALMGYEELVYALVDEPEACMEFFEAHTDYRIKYLEKVAAYYKPDFVSCFDDVAFEGGLFLTKAQYKEFIKPQHKRFNDRAYELGIKPIQHCCGKAEVLIEDFIEEGAVAWTSVQPTNDIASLLQKYGDKIAIVGGFNTNGAPSRLDATEEMRRAEVHRVMDTYAPYGSFMISNLIVQAPTKEEAMERNRQLMDEAIRYGKDFYRNR